MDHSGPRRLAGVVSDGRGVRQPRRVLVDGVGPDFTVAGFAQRVRAASGGER